MSNSDCDGDGGGGGGGGGEDVYSGRAEPVLVSLSDSYSEDEEISVCYKTRVWTDFM